MLIVILIREDEVFTAIYRSFARYGTDDSTDLIGQRYALVSRTARDKSRANTVEGMEFISHQAVKCVKEGLHEVSQTRSQKGGY